jgi:hypothetical protein
MRQPEDDEKKTVEKGAFSNIGKKWKASQERQRSLPDPWPARYFAVALCVGLLIW